MHLKTLTLRGFKSFASATALEFEPGITCVVGPNGSGKSNIVDALAWVMGEQGPKTLRGGKMEDVIFSGTAARAPLGRAEVSLTIDNHDGVLPIEYSEVTIARTLFRHGGSEYFINGDACRLLDIQELLSDTGLGREMHVVVSQGHLDDVLRATPEERRYLIEEAAGILKHRRRKEKALRKLDAMQANLTRVQDLTVEIRRQLGPLGKQAEIARQAQTIQADVRDARARLLADDVAQLRTQFEREEADETALLERRKTVEAELAGERKRLVDLERESAEATPALTKANDVYYRLSAIRERYRNLATLAEERLRLLGTQGAALPPTDLVDLDEQLERARAAKAELDSEVKAASAALGEAEAGREEAEERAAESERTLANLLRSVADRREGVARLAGDVAARRSRVEASEEEIGRLQQTLAEAEKRGNDARVEFTSLESTVASVESGEEDLDRAHETATGDWEAAKAKVEEVSARLTEGIRERDTWAAKVEALELSLTRKDGAGELLARGTRGVRGTVASIIDISGDAEDAIAAALGPLADALAVESFEDAVDAIRWLRDEDAGRARFVVADPGAVVDDPDLDLPGDVAWASSLVTGPEGIVDTVRAHLSGIAVVDDLASARALVAAHPGVVAVTRGGDILGRRSAFGGAGDAPSVLHMQAALDEATAKRDAAAHTVEEATFEAKTAEEREAAARTKHEATLARLHESDARLAAVAEQLGQLGAAIRASRGEADRIRELLEEARERIAGEQRELLDLSERLAAAQAEPEQTEADTREAQAKRDGDAEAANQARVMETEARLALRTAEERARAAEARVDSLAFAADAERDARARVEEAAAKRERQSRAAREVLAATRIMLESIDGSVQGADDRRAAVEQKRTERVATLAQVRSRVEELAGEYARLTDDAHRDEVSRAQQKVRLEQFEQRAVDDLGMDPATLVEEYGPHLPVPSGVNEAGEALTEPYDREGQEKRLRRAERALIQLGRVNPLALEEFTALEERHKFLADQVADIKKSRTDLLHIVEDIDERVERIFADAFKDTATAFDDVFPRLFPGGEGRLVLTEPKDMLNTGVDIEAKPAGKKVKRLSLLSGGERALTAIALLISIFKARPSPFYIMDEVEASLDDVNLGRLLGILHELQQDSQLIIVTHQKRTMEIADALYGATMRDDGVTTIVSQRLKEAVA